MSFPTPEQVLQLPVHHRLTIPPDYMDAMQHMNVRWYMALFDAASWAFFETFGMDADYYRSGFGGFALKQFIQYLAEVRLGETVALHGRIIGRSAKRIHFMLFMFNETTGKLAATMEALGTNADMSVRRTAPYSPEMAARIDAILIEHQALDWEAPICGIIQP